MENGNRKLRIRLKVFYTDFLQIPAHLSMDAQFLRNMQSLDKLRLHSAFFCCEGEYVNTGVGFGAIPKCNIIKRNMEVYEKFEIEDDFGDIKPCPFYTTKILKDEGFKFPIKKVSAINDITVYPNEYFNPSDCAKEKLKITSRTYSIHHYAASWMTVQQKRGAIEQHFYRIYSKKYGEKIAGIWSYLYWCKKENGGVGVINSLIKRFNR